jgi:hypothetical protein
MNGNTMKVGDVVELDYTMANLKSIQSKIKLTTVVVAPKGEEVLASIVPGKLLTEEQREKLRVENAAASADAQALAADQRARDLAEGKGEPVVNTIAEVLKDKLTNEEFSNPQPPVADATLPPAQTPVA